MTLLENLPHLTAQWSVQLKNKMYLLKLNSSNIFLLFNAKYVKMDIRKKILTCQGHSIMIYQYYLTANDLRNIFLSTN